MAKQKTLDDFYIDTHKKYKCSPNVYYHLDDIIDHKHGKFASCFSPDQLIKLANAYNKWNGSNGSGNPIKIPSRKDPDFTFKLWKSLNDALMKNCSGNESCWVSLPFIKLLDSSDQQTLTQFTFKPPRPMGKNKRTPNAWLSNFDISHVLAQYEVIFPDFVFLGPYPIDFAEHFSLYGFSPETITTVLKKKFKRIAIVFNTGTLKSGGKHWISLFLDFRNPEKATIEYFDSVGYAPPRVINNLINTIKESVCHANSLKCYNILEYTKQLDHQKGSTECGVYSLYFITERLKGRSYADIQANEMPDNVMFEFRNKFFT